MFRIASLFFVVACAPVYAEVDGPSPGTSVPQPGCDVTVEVASEWSHSTRDYGFVRGIDAFDASGERFVQSGGAYMSVQRVFDVPSGLLVSESPMSTKRALVHHPISHTDLFFSDGTVEIVDSRTGELRSAVQMPGRAWPAVALDGQTIAVFTCDDDEQAAISTYDLQGRELATTALSVECRPYGEHPFAFHEASGTAVIDSDDHAIVVDLDTSDLLHLSPHKANPDVGSVAGIMHELWISPNGKVVATAGVDGELRWHDPYTGELLSTRDIRVLPVNRNVYVASDVRSAFAWSADGRFSARGLDDDTVVIERVCDGAIVATLDVDPEIKPMGATEPAGPAALYFSPNGEALVAMYEGGVQGFLLSVE